MGDEDRRYVDLLQERANLTSKRSSNLSVESTERLIEEQDLRIVREGAGDRDSLLLPAGKLRGILGGMLFKVYELN